jgi:carboxypeptidase Taq
VSLNFAKAGSIIAPNVFIVGPQKKESMAVLLSMVLALFLLQRSVRPFDTLSSFQSLHRRASTIFVGSATVRCFASTMTAAASDTTSLPGATPPSPYTKLIAKLESITHLERCKAVLGYDQLVFMPEAAAAERGAQMGALATLIHEQKTSMELKELLATAEPPKGGEGLADSSPQRLLELERKAFAENERIPKDLAAKAAQLGASAYQAWVEAKTAQDYARFAPVLQDCFTTAMDLARAKRGDNADVSLYTQMLDEFEMGMSQERIDEIFATVQAALVPLIQKVTTAPYQPSSACLRGTFDVAKQQTLGCDIVKQLGFDDKQGRVDVSVHPFTSSIGGPKDVRITSRYRTEEWYNGLAGMIHEAGHAMYEQNLRPSALRIDSALSMGTHESQSLFWERHIGLSKPFWQWALPQWQAAFPEALANVSVDDVYEAVNAVEPSLIRVEADELTYPLHVILRYGIEKDVIAGRLAVADIPQRWNDDMQRMLGVTVPNDAKGCMQDVHWPSMAFGYFPTYLIGSATAAQLAHYCTKELDLPALCAAGDFAPIKAWLTQKVHCHGMRYKSLDALLEDQLGERLNPQYFIDYLDTKYSAIYKVI